MIIGVLKHINWLSVIIAAFGYFALGAIWYSFLFKNKWIEYNKINMDDANGKKDLGAIMIASFLMMFLCSAGIAIIAEYMDLHKFYHALHIGLITGVCFASASIAINMLYEKKPLGLFFINAGYQLLGNIIAAVVIVCWR